MKNTTLFIVILSSVGFLLNLIFHRYLTHNMSPAAYGDFCIGLNILEIASTFLLFGTEISAMKFIPLLQKKHAAQSFITWNFHFVKKLFYGFLSLVVFSIFVLTVLENTKDLHTSFWIILATPIAALYALMLVYLNTQNLVLLSTGINTLLRYLLLIAIFFLFFDLLHIKVTGIMLSGIYLTVFSILAIFTIILYNRKNKTTLPFALFFSNKKLFFNQQQEWKSSSIKYLFSNLLFLLFIYIDKIILETVHEDENIVGHYAAIVLLAGLFSLVSQSSGTFLSPHISGLLHDNKNLSQLQNLIRKANKNLFTLFTILFLVYVIFGKTILSYFGKNGEYESIYYGLIFLSASQIFLEIGNVSLRFLLYGGHTEFINKILLSALITLFILGILLTYTFGIYGIILAHILASLFYMYSFTVKAKQSFSQLKLLQFI
jgi:O-antigen/teichoic acid export membrane protein